MLHQRPRGLSVRAALGPPSLVQVIAAAAPLGSPVNTVRFPADTTVGNTIVAVVIIAQVELPSNDVVSIVDDQSQNYSAVAAAQGPEGYRWATHIWEFINTVAGVRDVTATISTDATWSSLTIYELTPCVNEAFSERVITSTGFSMQCAEDPGLTSVGPAFGIAAHGSMGSSTRFEAPPGWTVAWEDPTYEYVLHREEPVQFVNEVVVVAPQLNAHVGCFATYVSV